MSHAFKDDRGVDDSDEAKHTTHIAKNEVLLSWRMRCSTHDVRNSVTYHLAHGDIPSILHVV